MSPKAHRLLLERVTAYADEAASYLRRRRLDRQPFARVHYAGGRVVAHEPDTETGRALYAAAAHLIDAAR